MKFGFDWPSVFCGEDVQRVWTMDERWACLHYKLTHETKGSGELKKKRLAAEFRKIVWQPYLFL